MSVANIRRRLEKLPDPERQDLITSIAWIAVESFQENGVRKIRRTGPIAEWLVA